MSILSDGKFQKQLSHLLFEAFSGHPHSVQNEYEIVEKLRSSHSLITEITDYDGDLLTGYCAFSPLLLNGKPAKWAGAGPLAVLPGYQNKGMGTALMQEGIRKLQSLGYEGCVLVGDPVFYSRFGFMPHQDMILENIPAEYFLVLSFSGIIPKAKVAFHPAFMES